MILFFIRSLFGLVLCVAAYLPIKFVYHSLSQIFSKQESLVFYFFHFCLLLLSSGLTYFFLLLAYRAFTGKGRKKDGELLPPVVMKIFTVVLLIVWIAAFAIKIYERDWVAAIYVLACLVGLGGYFYSKIKKPKIILFK